MKVKVFGLPFKSYTEAYKTFKVKATKLHYRMSKGSLTREEAIIDCLIRPNECMVFAFKIRFDTINICYDAFGVSRSSVCKHRREGLTLEEAIIKTLVNRNTVDNAGTSKPIPTSKGLFPSINAACRAFEVNERSIRQKKLECPTEIGRVIEEISEKNHQDNYYKNQIRKKKSIVYKLQKGMRLRDIEKFGTIKRMREHYGVSETSWGNWRKKGYNVREAIYLNLSHKRRNNPTSSNKSQRDRAYRSARKRRVRLATPPWADISKIANIYQLRSDGEHVDHIIPLNHHLVCGLHVHNNLRVIPEEENLKKSNYFEIECVL